MTAPATRVVSAKRQEKLRERWADPQYAEREKARLRAMSQEQRDALAFFRAHREDPRLAPPPPPPPGAPAPVQPAPPKPRPRPTRKSSRRSSSGKPIPASSPPSPATSATSPRPFFLRRRPS